MNEWLKNTIAKLKELWGKWKPIQKVILAGIIVVVIIAIFMAVRFSAAPSMVPLFNTPITDQKSRDDITYRLDEENIKYVVSQSGVISVADETTARRLRGILIRENLVPTTVDPFSLFDVTSWSTTDFERNVNLQRSITRMVTQHLEALDDIASANVVITAPEEELFTSNQKPVTASVILYFKPGSDMPTNRKKLKGVQDLVLRAVVGLTEDNLTISDSAGNILNDFKGMAESDAVDIVKKQQDLRHKEEVRLSAKVLNALRRNFNEDRVCT